MTIETKYNIGDEVWCSYCRIKAFTIEGIKVTTKDVRKWCIKRFTETIIEYLLDGEWVNESDLFPTKEELLNKVIECCDKLLNEYLDAPTHRE